MRRRGSAESVSTRGIPAGMEGPVCVCVCVCVCVFIHQCVLFCGIFECTCAFVNVCVCKYNSECVLLSTCVYVVHVCICECVQVLSECVCACVPHYKQLVQ